METRDSLEWVIFFSNFKYLLPTGGARDDYTIWWCKQQHGIFWRLIKISKKFEILAIVDWLNNKNAKTSLI